MTDTLVNDMVDEVTSFLAASPAAEEIIGFKLSESIDRRLHELLERNSDDMLSVDERSELEQYLWMDHFLTMLKLKARLKLEQRPALNFPVDDLGPWPEDLSLGREDMYGDDGR